MAYVGNIAQMLGLFRTPRDKIKKRLEQGAYVSLASVETYSDMKLDYLPRIQREYAVGFILSVWACNSGSHGHISLSQSDHTYMKNFGIFCANRLPSDTLNRTKQVMDELMEAGLVPRATKPRKRERSTSKRRSRTSDR